MAVRAGKARDNSLSDLSFDFLDGEQHPREGLPAKTEPPAEAEVQTPVAEAAAGASAEVSPPPASAPAPAAAEVAGVVSAPRRHAWGAFYLLRTVILVLVVFAVGSLLLTMLLNPGMTFDEAVRLLLSRAGDVVERMRGLFA